LSKLSVGVLSVLVIVLGVWPSPILQQLKAKAPVAAPVHHVAVK
jgi:hypothetical protein